MTDVLAVERLTFGFDALAHRDRQVVFVPYGAPGDHVVAETVERHAQFVRARIVEVAEPGPARVLPGCRYFPTCGGCQWQHVAPPAQRDAKAAIVAEQLARTAGVRDAEVLPTLTAGGDWHYRARLTLVVEGRRAGYHRARSHHLLEVEDCPIADPVLSAHLDAARDWVGALRVPLRRVSLAVAPGGVVLTAIASALPGTHDLEVTTELLARMPTVRGAVLADARAERRLVAGDPHVRVALEPGLDLEVPADVFTQVNPDANRLLVASVIALGGFAPGERVLDLYAGAGNFTLPIARRGACVVGIDLSAKLLAIARRHEETDPRGIAYVQADAQNLDDQMLGLFDGVVCFLALMDIPNLAPTLHSVARILRPGGRMMIADMCIEKPIPDSALHDIDLWTG